MSSTIIPKEQLTAFQRWELSSFEPQPAQTPAAGAAPGVPLPTAAQVAQIEEQARAQGYTEGYTAGKAMAAAEAKQIARLVGAVERELNDFDLKVGETLAALAIDVARQVIRQSLRIRPELLIEVVREAVTYLPPFGAHGHLVLNPSDAEMVRTQLGEELSHASWRIVEDPRVERGGCRAETSHTQIDATLATRWQRVVAALGRDDAWTE